MVRLSCAVSVAGLGDRVSAGIAAATAIAMPPSWLSEMSTREMPCRWAIACAVPLSTTYGTPLRPVRTSIACHGTDAVLGTCSTFSTASLAANRPASRSSAIGPSVCARSTGVKTRAR